MEVDTLVERCILEEEALPLMNLLDVTDINCYPVQNLLLIIHPQVTPHACLQQSNSHKQTRHDHKVWPGKVLKEFNNGRGILGCLGVNSNLLLCLLCLVLVLRIKDALLLQPLLFLCDNFCENGMQVGGKVRIQPRISDFKR